MDILYFNILMGSFIKIIYLVTNALPSRALRYLLLDNQTYSHQILFQIRFSAVITLKNCNLEDNLFEF